MAKNDIKTSSDTLRNATANLYMETIMGTQLHESIVEAVNGDSGETRSLEYYMGAEKMLSYAISALSKISKEETLNKTLFTSMMGYIDFEVVRIQSNENNS